MKMGIIIAMLAVAMAAASSPVDATTKHVVGGAAGWTFGFNYSAWAVGEAPFFTGDSLVFHYEPRVFMNMTVNHNVYLFPDLAHFEACDFTNATMLAGPAQGNPGFEYQLTERAWYHFACGVKAGLHCNQGLMKFRVKAMHHHSHMH